MPAWAAPHRVGQQQEGLHAPAQDDEFEVTLDDGTEDGGGQGPASGYAPNRYVRPGAQVPQQAPIVGAGYRAPLPAARQLPPSALSPLCMQS